jgi:SAM-dependent methyltransferase
MSDLYGERFFAEMNAGRDAYRRLAACMWRAAGPAKTVLDLGCGSGLVIQWMREQGAHVRGLDLFGSNADLEIIRYDLERPVPAASSAELVICTETAEHLPESAADTLATSCASTAERAIVWSAAPPGQEGDGHINCQPPGYWLERFAARGWVPRTGASLELRRLMVSMHAQHEFCAENFYVLGRL